MAMMLLLIQVPLGALRWHAIRARLGDRTSFGDTLQLFYIAVFFNSYLWGAVSGDVLRAWLSSRNELGAKVAVSSVVLDKIVAVAGVAVLVLLCTPLMMVQLGTAVPLVLPAGLAAAGLAAVFATAQLERLPPEWQKARFVRLLQAIGGSTRLVFFDPTTAATALGFAILPQLALGAAAFAIAASLKIDVSILACVALLQPVALLAALPISVGGWGVRETTMIVLLGLIGVTPSAALVLSVQLGILSLLAVLPGGAVWLLRRAKGPASGPRS
jgi:uncharacterized membrane protein YbhN (UPF0104 family)